MEHHHQLNAHTMMATNNHTSPSHSPSNVIERESAVISSIASHPGTMDNNNNSHNHKNSNHNSPEENSSSAKMAVKREESTSSPSSISAIVSGSTSQADTAPTTATTTVALETTRNQSQSVKSNSTHENGNGNAQSATPVREGNAEEQSSSSSSSVNTSQLKSTDQTLALMAGSEEEKKGSKGGNTSPHTHVITEAPSSRSELQLKQGLSASSSPILNHSLVSNQQMSPGTTNTNSSMVIAVTTATDHSPESMSNSNSNGSNPNSIIQELPHAQIISNEQLNSWQQHQQHQQNQQHHQHQANRGGLRPSLYGGNQHHRLQPSLGLEQQTERDNESPHPQNPSSPRFYLQQQLQQHHR